VALLLKSRKMKTIIQLLICLLIFSSCKKEEPETTISGIVVNYGTLKPIDSVMVTVVSGAGNGTFGSTKGSGSEISTYTDHLGKFSVSIKGENLFLYLKKDKYRYDEEIFGAYKSYTAGKDYLNEILKFKAKSFFNPVFIFKSCKITDSIYLNIGSSIPNAYQKTIYLNYGEKPFQPFGGIGMLVIGDFFNPYWIKYQIDGQWKEKIDSVYVKSFETFTDTIYY